MKALLRLNPGRRLAGLPIARQLFIAFSLVFVLTAVLGALALDGLSRVDARVASLADKSLRGVGLLADIRSALVESHDMEVKHSRSTDASYYSEYEEKMAAAAKTIDAEFAQYDALKVTAQGDALSGKFAKSWSGYHKVQGQIIELGRAKKQGDAADISDGAGGMAFDEAIGALGALNKQDFADAADAAAGAHAVYQRSGIAVAALLGAALLLGVGLAWAITRHLLRQLGGEPAAAAEITRAVAAGDLTAKIVLKPGDDESLMARLASMQRALADAVTNVRRGSENVARASTEIAQGNQALSSRTEQQASALQETAATMDELGAIVRNNADNASQANQLALGASNVAVKGGALVEQVVQTMKGINDSSKKIVDIIGTIDGIAFQTNILALNAAVEAARAGEQGRGFAVVAAEVRSLAQRSAAAAKEIKVLIGASVERVDRGSALVDQAGQTMTEIVKAIKRVTDIVGEISSASAEQSAGVAQVGQAMTQMDQATQRNAALVEQSAAAADSMKQQAQELVAAVAVFKLSATTMTPELSPTSWHHSVAAAARVIATPVAPVASATPQSIERRGANRATNVARLKHEPRPPARAPAAATARVAAAGDGESWETF